MSKKNSLEKKLKRKDIKEINYKMQNVSLDVSEVLPFYNEYKLSKKLDNEENRKRVEAAKDAMFKAFDLINDAAAYLLAILYDSDHKIDDSFIQGDFFTEHKDELEDKIDAEDTAEDNTEDIVTEKDLNFKNIESPVEIGKHAGSYPVFCTLDDGYSYSCGVKVIADDKYILIADSVICIGKRSKEELKSLLGKSLKVDYSEFGTRKYKVTEDIAFQSRTKLFNFIMGKEVDPKKFKDKLIVEDSDQTLDRYLQVGINED